MQVEAVTSVAVITADGPASRGLFRDALGLPLKQLDGDYYASGEIGGVQPLRCVADRTGRRGLLRHAQLARGHRKAPGQCGVRAGICRCRDQRRKRTAFQRSPDAPRRQVRALRANRRAAAVPGERARRPVVRAIAPRVRDRRVGAALARAGCKPWTRTRITRTTRWPLIRGSCKRSATVGVPRCLPTWVVSDALRRGHANTTDTCPFRLCECRRTYKPSVTRSDSSSRASSAG